MSKKSDEIIIETDAVDDVMSEDEKRIAFMKEWNKIIFRNPNHPYHIPMTFEDAEFDFPTSALRAIFQFMDIYHLSKSCFRVCRNFFYESVERIQKDYRIDLPNPKSTYRFRVRTEDERKRKEKEGSDVILFPHPLIWYLCFPGCDANSSRKEMCVDGVTRFDFGCRWGYHSTKLMDDLIRSNITSGLSLRVSREKVGLKLACRGGHVETVKLFIEKYGVEITNIFLEQCVSECCGKVKNQDGEIAKNQCRILEYLLRPPSPTKGGEEVKKRGKERKAFPNRPWYSIIRTAVENGRVDILEDFLKDVKRFFSAFRYLALDIGALEERDSDSLSTWDNRSVRQKMMLLFRKYIKSYKRECVSDETIQFYGYCRNGMLDEAKVLIQNPNVRLDWEVYCHGFFGGANCLVAASHNRNNGENDSRAELVRLLLKGVDQSMEFAFAMSCWKGNKEVAKVLLEEGVNPSCFDNNCIWNAYMYPDIVRMLLEDERVDPSARDSTCLRKACSRGHRDTVRALLECDRFQKNITIMDTIIIPDLVGVKNLNETADRVGAVTDAIIKKDLEWLIPFYYDQLFDPNDKQKELDELYEKLDFPTLFKIIETSTYPRHRKKMRSIAMGRILEVSNEVDFDIYPSIQKKLKRLSDEIEKKYGRIRHHVRFARDNFLLWNDLKNEVKNSVNEEREAKIRRDWKNNFVMRMRAMKDEDFIDLKTHQSVVEELRTKSRKFFYLNEEKSKGYENLVDEKLKNLKIRVEKSQNIVKRIAKVRNAITNTEMSHVETLLRSKPVCEELKVFRNEMIDFEVLGTLRYSFEELRLSSEPGTFNN